MKYTNLFTKTNKESKEFDSVNATYLIKGGFIDQTMAGVYSFLPLGTRVLRKIENIIRSEMDKMGQELLLSNLAPKSLWEQSGRLNTIDVLFGAVAANDISKAKNDADYILNCTQEDVVTPISKKFNISYKDLPKAVYQIQYKFRNEARPKSGLLRTREFIMKDMYSFHTSEEDLLKFYEKSKVHYMNVYEKLGIGDITHITMASGGDFTKNYSHEFQTRCETGEDIVFHAKSKGLFFNKEVAPSKVPETYEKEELKAMEKIETVAITGVQALADFLKMPIKKCVKTMIYQADERIVAAAVRGDYDINEVKLQKVLDCSSLQLASEEVVNKVTGAQLGYAGLIGLTDEVEVYIDDSIEGLINFECGANETDAHNINVNFGRDIELPERFYDFKEAKEGDLYPETGEEYEVFKASEVGNVFPLNTKFSKAFDYTYTDENGEEKLVYMGSYGIGPTRVMGILVELFNDDKGIIWPENVAPFKVHLVGLNLDDTDVMNKANEIYEHFGDLGVEVLYDDRINARAGDKFADADLIGCPYRIVVSRKTLEQGSSGDLVDYMVEVKKRSEGDDSAKIMSIGDFLNIA